MWNYLGPLAAVLLFLLDVGVVAACAVVHFKNGFVLFGSFTVGIFLLAGLITNWFNYYRHEQHRMDQRSWPKKISTYLLLFFPSYSLMSWLWVWLRHPGSWMANYWVGSLRLFYTTTGSLTQAFLQTYLIIHLWWDDIYDPGDFIVMEVAAVMLALDAVDGVVTYIYKEHFEEEHEKLHLSDVIVILFSVTFNMCGRIVLMAVVAAVNGWWYLAAALSTPLLLNYAMCYFHMPKANNNTKAAGFRVKRCFFPLPIALLFAMTVSKSKSITFLTTVSWLCYSLPQIIYNHDTVIMWVTWCVPAVAQILALVLLLAKWAIFKDAFSRFIRIIEQPSPEGIRKNQKNNNPV